MDFTIWCAILGSFFVVICSGTDMDTKELICHNEQLILTCDDDNDGVDVTSVIGGFCNDASPPQNPACLDSDVNILAAARKTCNNSRSCKIKPSHAVRPTMQGFRDCEIFSIVVSYRCVPLPDQEQTTVTIATRAPPTIRSDHRGRINLTTQEIGLHIVLPVIIFVILVVVIIVALLYCGHKSNKRGKERMLDYSIEDDSPVHHHDPYMIHTSK